MSAVAQACARRASCALLSLVMLASCTYRTKTSVTLTPVKTRFPVSASASYRTAQGETVAADGYRVVRPFELDAEVAGSLHDASSGELDLSAELERVVAADRADAITRLQIEATDYDPGSHRGSARWKLVAATFALVSSPFLAMGAVADDESQQTVLLGSGAGILGVGLLCFVFSVVGNEDPRWKFHVTGQTVKALPQAGATANASRAP